MESTLGQQFTAKEVAAHRDSKDAWIIVNGEVYDVSKYIHDHPGGAEILMETAGADATEAFENASHSDDAIEIMAALRVGSFKGRGRNPTTKPVRVTPRLLPSPPGREHRHKTSVIAGVFVVGLGSSIVYFATSIGKVDASAIFRYLQPSRLQGLNSSGPTLRHPGFLEGIIVSSLVFAMGGGILGQKLLRLLHYNSGALRYAPHIKLPKRVIQEPLNQRGWLEPTVYQSLPLVEKTTVALNTYRFVFALPSLDTVVGIPIGQHVAIRARIDGASISRSYTPVSNNVDKGVLELVIKCYPDGLLSGRYLAHLKVGDEVEFRGPTGAMHYHRGFCKKIGMLAGGTGITPMYQLIRAICEDDRDVTEISLIYANRTEEDILLRKKLDDFSRKYPKNLKVFYMLDNPPKSWTGGSGFVTKDIMEERLPSPNPQTKMMLCGPPGMIKAAKAALGSLGFELPGAAGKMSDAVFCF